jgi:hypothetical protein
MKFETEVWPISKLVELYGQNKIKLDPPYQRNPIWTLKSQQKLIETITQGMPIPNFFLQALPDGVFEMVDGQQRARTILGYERNQIPDENNLLFNRKLEISRNRKVLSDEFFNYPLTVTIILELPVDWKIEQFYDLVNSSGLRLNRPELKKAKYFTTLFLKLILEVAASEEIKALRLFNTSTVSRMNDVDFISELLALLHCGISDKKEKVDEMYEDDISEADYARLKGHFCEVLTHFTRFDRIQPLIRTRFKQKNDFYSLFHLFNQLRSVDPHTLDYFYQVLVKIGRFIRPSQEDCEPLMQYAYNCVTQSNSKNARSERHRILSEILLNRGTEPNATQRALLDFFRMSENQTVQLSGYLTLEFGSIKDPHQDEFGLDNAL